MTKAKPKYTPVPRAWDDFQVAARLNKGVAWFYAHRSDLEAAGFPRFDDLLGGRDANAIEAWMDSRSGLAQAANDEQIWMEAIDGKG